MDICSRTEQELLAIDCETIRTLGLKIHDSVFSLMIVPFWAITIRGVEDYWQIKLLDPESDKRIYDLRNSLKIYQDRFRRIKIRFLETDETSDALFRNMLRFDFLKRLNVHYNIGIYVTNDGKVVGNTQWIDSYSHLNKEKSEVRERKAYDMGHIMGSAIQSACNIINPSIPVKSIELGSMPEIGYIDFNTNKASEFFRGSWSKEIQLAFLHLLSVVNFEKYVLESVLPADNEWLFRVKYVVIHYVLSGIEKIYRHCNADNKMEKTESEKFQKLIIDRWILSSSELRGCMMHYRLKDKNQKSLMKEDSFDEKLPFNGLIESIFEGMSFDTYDHALSTKRDEIEKFLEEQFFIDVKKIKKFDDRNGRTQ